MSDLTSQFNGQPAMYDPDAQALVESCLKEVSASKDIKASLTSRGEDFWDPMFRSYRPYDVQDGALVIPVQGALLHNFPINFGAYATGYDYISAALERGLADEAVDRIVLDIHSPGGAVAGCFTLVEQIYKARDVKPITAVANEAAYSAAYAIASAATEIVAPATAGVGSVGVITAHFENSEMMKKMGVRLSFIFAGKRKADGNSAEPLSDEVRARIQSRIDALYDHFVSTVARNRGIDESAVRNTEAGTYSAAEALEIGLIDRIALPEHALATTAATTETTEEDDMSTTDQAAELKAATDAARAEGKAEGLAEGKAEGATAERARLSEILSSDAAKSRPISALTYATETDMSAEKIVATLDKLPAEAAAAPTGASFDTMMSTTPNPNVGADDPAATNNNDDDPVAAILSDQRAATGA